MGLENLNDWPNKVKIMQKNWIGKSYGCEIDFEIENCSEFKKIKIFTTRPDTLFGCSFLALSVDHPLSKLFKDDSKFKVSKINVIKWEQQKRLLLKPKNLVLIQIYLQKTLLIKNKSSNLFCKFCSYGLRFWYYFW